MQTETEPVCRRRTPRIVSGFFAALLLLTLVHVPAPQPVSASGAEAEPNGTVETANPMTLGSAKTGSTFSGSSSDSDYFYVDVPTAGRLTLDLTFPSSLGTSTVYALYVYNADGDTMYYFSIGGGDWAGADLRATAMYAPAGRMYFRIYGSSSWASWNQPYAFTASLTPGLVETERNGSTAEADMPGLAATVAGSSFSSSSSDSDYYAYDLPADGRLTIDLRFPSSLGTSTVYYVYVYNADGDTMYYFSIPGSQWAGAPLRQTAMYMPAGRLYVRIYGTSSSASWGQAYALNVSSRAGSVETEWNNSTAEADGLAQGKGVSGSTLSSSSSDSDYYAVELPRSGRYVLNFTFPRRLGTSTAYYVYVYDANGTTLFDFDVDGGDWAGRKLRSSAMNLRAGRIYVRVYGSSSLPTWGKPYRLNVLRLLSQTPKPSITGAARVGQVLTARPGTWSPQGVTLRYQWLRNGKAIKGAKSSTYRLVSADRGRRIAVRVTGSKAGYLTVVKTSSAVVPT